MPKPTEPVSPASVNLEPRPPEPPAPFFRTQEARIGLLAAVSGAAATALGTGAWFAPHNSGSELLLGIGAFLFGGSALLGIGHNAIMWVNEGE